ncbi:MAG: UDP-N-acetylenolpyruvoylglucosamine reductase, partial [Oscillospiraceae bacterium]
AYRSSFYTGKNEYLIIGAEFKLEKSDKEVIYAKMKEHLNARKQKQPLNFKSGGSTFKRPQGAFAGKLIADSGLAGYQIGDAQVSEKHCGFIINRGSATATDIEILIDYVKQEVKRKTGYELECEVKWIDEMAVFI